MRDGSTRRIDINMPTDTGFEEWLTNWQGSMIVTSGDAAGTEYAIDAPSISIGRGEEATWSFADDSMSNEHAALEFADAGIRLRDLGSMNGCRVNGATVLAADLKHGDRIELGGLALQFVLERRERAPRTYVIESD
ncbi:MAG: FHA domain-containing protein [Deltaproteobacteria bacterium]|nr:FHA domain-containing protein [Deltaproteobacteria bacterium]MBW2362024.1 FHA domain-containing protein [Deltaproteobacteria bacterium]